VLELSHGYVFGRVRYAPPEPPSETDFKNKPKNYSAGVCTSALLDARP
jgi:hypothetical protein